MYRLLVGLLLAGGLLGQGDPVIFGGVVVNAKTGESIPRVQLTLRGIGRGAEQEQARAFTTSSMQDGRFQYLEVPPGQYVMQAEKTGFVQMSGPPELPSANRIFTIAPGSRQLDFKVEMQPQAVITGKISDEAGEPMSGVVIQLMKPSYLNGKRQFMGVHSAVTNDLGEFRLFGLAKGRYYLSAVRQSQMYGNVRSGMAHSEENYVTLFYPGSIDIKAAAPLDVVPGSQLQGIDMRLVKARTVRVRGKVSGVDLQNLRQGLSVVMVPREGGGSVSRNFSSSGVSPETGAFEIGGVVPGSYHLIADAFLREEKQHLTARVPVDVGNAEIDNVNVTLSSGINLAGFIKLDGEPPQGFSKNMTVVLTPREGMITGGTSARVKDDLSFNGLSLTPDLYSVNVAGLRPEAYIKSVLIGDQETRDQPLQIQPGSAGPLQIVISFNGGEVEGVVKQDDTPMPNAFVALVPSDLTRRSLAFLYRTASTDKNGHYLLRGVAPGDYKVFAWDKIEPGAYQSPEFLQTFENDGAAVSVQEKGKETVGLKLLAGGQ